MSELTLDAAIKHCFEVAEEQEIIGGRSKSGIEKMECERCAADHKQLAEWLTELKEAKRLLKFAVEDCPDLTDMWRYADKVLEMIGDE